MYCGHFVTAYLDATAAVAGNLFTCPGHTFVNTDTVALQAVPGSSLPGGFSTGTIYYVGGVSGNTFTLSLTSGGAAVTVSAAGSCLIGKIQAKTILIGDTPSFAADAIQIQGS
jgi:hypothetical protein